MNRIYRHGCLYSPIMQLGTTGTGIVPCQVLYNSLVSGFNLGPVMQALSL